MSAGKGDGKRPYNQEAWDAGHDRIWGKKLITPNHFAEVFKGSSDKPDFKPQAESQLPKADEPQKCEICEALDSSIPI